MEASGLSQFMSTCQLGGSVSYNRLHGRVEVMKLDGSAACNRLARFCKITGIDMERGGFLANSQLVCNRLSGRIGDMKLCGSMTDSQLVCNRLSGRIGDTNSGVTPRGPMPVCVAPEVHNLESSNLDSMLRPETVSSERSLHLVIQKVMVELNIPLEELNKHLSADDIGPYNHDIIRASLQLGSPHEHACNPLEALRALRKGEASDDTGSYDFDSIRAMIQHGSRSCDPLEAPPKKEIESTGRVIFFEEKDRFVPYDYMTNEEFQKAIDE